MTTLVNLCPHALAIQPGDESTRITILPTVPAARVAVTNAVERTVNGIPISRSVYGAIENLPDTATDVIYIVSMLVAQRAQRADVVSPDSGPTAIREAGQVVAVRGLVAW